VKVKVLFIETAQVQESVQKYTGDIQKNMSMNQGYFQLLEQLKAEYKLVLETL